MLTQLRRDGLVVSKKSVEASRAAHGVGGGASPAPTAPRIDFAEACGRLGVTQSMGRVGSALDNACAESFFSTLQHELVSRRRWTTRDQARADITAWIDTWYNPKRLQSANNMTSPNDHELANAA